MGHAAGSARADATQQGDVSARDAPADGDAADTGSDAMTAATADEAIKDETDRVCTHRSAIQSTSATAPNVLMTRAFMRNPSSIRARCAIGRPIRISGDRRFVFNLTTHEHAELTRLSVAPADRFVACETQ